MIAGNSHKALVALVLILSVSFMLPQRTQACGPFFTNAIFVYSKHPDMPLENFATGKLGILQTTWARSYLVAAYRNLAGSRLSESEAKAIKSVWDDRLNNSWESHDDQWIKNWTEARKKVPGLPEAPKINAYRNREKPHEYESFLNCQQDAFENAEATLNERIKRFGADSIAVRDWVDAQDKVFANCGDGKQIPEATSAGQDPLIRADRTYQIAAANFYATNYDEARQQFDSIAQDKSSPWRDKAGYLAARAQLRKGSLADKEEEGRPALADAETRLNAVLKDGSAAASHHASKRLLNLVRLRLHPEAKLHEIAHALIKKDASLDFKQDVWDYTVLLDKFLGDDSEGDEATKPKLPASITSDELTDWILTFEGDLDNAAAHSLERWEKTKALPWLVAAISQAQGQQPRAAALSSAAAAVDHTSPAFPSLAFHTVRLLIESNRGSEARATLDKILTDDRQHMTPSALNLLLAQRTTLAQNLDEFLQSAPRVPAGFSDDSDGREIPEEDPKETTKGDSLFFDLDAANAFNKAMPVALIKDAARSKALAPNLRRDVAQAAFVRAAMIDDRDTASQAAVVVQEMYPQLKEFLASYQRAATPDARRFAAAFLSLKFPGLRPFVSAGTGRVTAVEEIDSYRDNYWCSEPPTPGNVPMGEGEEGKTKATPIPVPEFLRGSKTLATSQFAALQALGTAPNYLCRIAIAWAEKNPADPRAPEALHLAVRSTRYGCTDKETGRWSKAAYDLLHRRYPNTTWAKNTKYWFKD
jgi:hypothetical protein